MSERYRPEEMFMLKQRIERLENELSYLKNDRYEMKRELEKLKDEIKRGLGKR